MISGMETVSAYGAGETPSVTPNMDMLANGGIAIHQTVMLLQSYFARQVGYGHVLKGLIRGVNAEPAKNSSR